MPQYIHITALFWLTLIPFLVIASTDNAADNTGVLIEPSKSRACIPKLIHSNDPPGSAVRCAEAFVVDNGYTNSSANRSRVVPESIERVGSVEEAMAWRGGSVKVPAIGICNRGFGGDDWTVIFARATANKLPTAGRSVTMKADYTELRMQHMDFDLSVLSDPTSGCRYLKR